MKKLEQYGVIRLIDHLYNGENVYCITKKGCSVIGLEYSGINKTDKLVHSLACSDFYFNVKDKGIKSLDLECQYYFAHKGKKYSFRPDLVIEIDRWYLVEIDLSNRRFESKVKTWEVWYESGKFKMYFDKYPPIVIVSNNVDKVKGIVERESSVGLNYIYKDYGEIERWEYGYDS